MARFVRHAGTAFGIFHRHVYEPFKAGRFKGPARHRLAFVRARAAVAVVAREVLLAKQVAQGSTALRKLFAPLAGLMPALSGLATKFQRGQVDSADLRSAAGAVASLEQISLASGVKITERAPIANR